MPFTVQNTEISLNFLVWKLYENAQLLTRNFAETVRFHKTYTPRITVIYAVLVI